MHHDISVSSKHVAGGGFVMTSTVTVDVASQNLTAHQAARKEVYQNWQYIHELCIA